MQAAIYAPLGLTLSDAERDFFRDSDPAGYILFRRNMEDEAQLRALTDALRDIHARPDLPILIDQEGGRVARMRPPAWPAFPSGEKFDRLYSLAPASAIEAARSNSRALGLMLRSVGINVNCLPVLDVRQPGGSDIIADRAYGSEPMQVAALGRAVLDGMASTGVIGVVKHMPGHGRALVDSHKELPLVTATEAELAIDLLPFERLAQAPMGMVAHILFEAWDRDRPSSQSPIVVNEIIRGRIGFNGFLMTDDISMNALEGSPGHRSAVAIAAGCDATLHCNGRLDEMIDIAFHVGPLGDEAEARLARAMSGARVGTDDGPDFAQAVALRDELLALV